MAITFTIQLAGGVNPLPHNTIGSSTSRTLSISSITGDDSNTVSDYSFEWFFIDKPGSTSSNITYNLGTNPDKDVITINSIDTWGTYRLFCIARHKETNNRSESNPLKAPESSFTNIRVQGPNYDLEKPAKGQRNWQDQYNTLIQTISDNMTAGSGTSYTDSDARAAISVTDAGGDGSLSYDNGTGVVTYTGPSASEVRAHFTAGTGISITNGEIAATGGGVSGDFLPKLNPEATGSIELFENEGDATEYINIKKNPYNSLDGWDIPSTIIESKINDGNTSNPFYLYNDDRVYIKARHPSNTGVLQGEIRFISPSMRFSFDRNGMTGGPFDDDNSYLDMHIQKNTNFGTPQNGQVQHSITGNYQISSAQGDIQLVSQLLPSNTSTRILSVQTQNSLNNTVTPITIGSGLSLTNNVLSTTGGSTGDFLTKLEPEATGSLRVFRDGSTLGPFLKIEADSQGLDIGSFSERSNFDSNPNTSNLNLSCENLSIRKFDSNSSSSGIESFSFRNSSDDRYFEIHDYNGQTDNGVGFKIYKDSSNTTTISTEPVGPSNSSSANNLKIKSAYRMLFELGDAITSFRPFYYFSFEDEDTARGMRLGTSGGTFNAPDRYFMKFEHAASQDFAIRSTTGPLLIGNDSSKDLTLYVNGGSTETPASNANTHKIVLSELGIIGFHQSGNEYLNIFDSTSGNFAGSVISSPAGRDLVLTSAGTNNNVEAILTGKGGAFYVSDNNSGARFDILSLNDNQGLKIHTAAQHHFTGSSLHFKATTQNYYFDFFPLGTSTDGILQNHLGQGADTKIYRDNSSSFFSAGHIYQCISGSIFEPGDVVSLNNNIIEFPQTNNSKLACGIIARLQEATEENPIPTSLGEEITSGICAKIISVGDNRFMDCEGFKVCNENGPIEAGDLLVTSSRPGYLMKQDDDIIRSKTVGKSMVDVVFDEDGLATNIYGFIYCG